MVTYSGIYVGIVPISDLSPLFDREQLVYDKR